MLKGYIETRKPEILLWDHVPVVCSIGEELMTSGAEREGRLNHAPS